MGDVQHLRVHSGWQVHEGKHAVVVMKLQTLHVKRLHNQRGCLVEDAEEGKLLLLAVAFQNDEFSHLMVNFTSCAHLCHV